MHGIIRSSLHLYHVRHKLHEKNIKRRMDPPGFEPGASALQRRRSPRLSYGPILSIGFGRILVSDYY